MNEIICIQLDVLTEPMDTAERWPRITGIRRTWNSFLPCRVSLARFYRLLITFARSACAYKWLLLNSNKYEKIFRGGKRQFAKYSHALLDTSTDGTAPLFYMNRWLSGWQNARASPPKSVASPIHFDTSFIQELTSMPPVFDWRKERNSKLHDCKVRINCRVYHEEIIW